MPRQRQVTPYSHGSVGNLGAASRTLLNMAARKGLKYAADKFSGAIRGHTYGSNTVNSSYGAKGAMLHRFRKASEKPPSKFAKHVQAVLADEQAVTHLQTIHPMYVQCQENQWTYVISQLTVNAHTLFWQPTLGGIRDIHAAASVCFNNRTPSLPITDATNLLPLQSVIKCQHLGITFELFNNTQLAKTVKIYECTAKAQIPHVHPYDEWVAQKTVQATKKDQMSASISELDPYISQIKSIYEKWDIVESTVHIEPGARFTFDKSKGPREYDLSKYGLVTDAATMAPNDYIKGQKVWFFSAINEFTSVHNETDKSIAGLHYPRDPNTQCLAIMYKKSYKFIAPDTAPVDKNVYGMVRFNFLTATSGTVKSNIVSAVNPVEMVNDTEKDL